MKKIGKALLRLIIAIVIINLPIILIAQPPIEDNVLDNPVPFDSGVILLVIVVILFAIREIVVQKKVYTNKS